jgi:hypothetical protein
VAAEVQGYVEISSNFRDRFSEGHIIRKRVKHSWKRTWRHHFFQVKKWDQEKKALTPAEQKALVTAQAVGRRWLAKYRYKKMLKMKQIRDKLVR